MLRKVGGIVLAIAVIVGMKMYSKQSTSKEVKAELVKLCEGDAKCVAAVDTHFEGCFDGSYSMGGRRRSAKLNSDALVSCVNQRAGVEYFSVTKD